jgi:hypothetical protein
MAAFNLCEADRDPSRAFANSDVRGKVFGDHERRQLADFRRSGATEALAGNAWPEMLSKKMANTLSAANKLHATYTPKQLASGRDVDATRKVERRKLRK